MKLRRKVALLSSCALILQSFVSVLPASAFDTQDNMAAFAYWKLPLGSPPNQDVEPTYGFTVGQTNQGWLFAPPDTSDSGRQDRGGNIAMPAIFDMHFGGAQDELPSVSFSGVDVVPVFTGQLNAVDQPGSEWTMGEWIAAGVGAVAVGVGACAAAGCFSDNGHHHGGEGGGGGEDV